MEMPLAEDVLSGDITKKIIDQFKSRGQFDQLRKECISDVDTKPAYQNLRHRIDTYVSSYLRRVKWNPHLNKNQLRENIKRHVIECAYLDSGIERIVDQLVNPRINPVIVPKVQEVSNEFLGLSKEKPTAVTGEKMNNEEEEEDEISPPFELHQLSDVDSGSDDSDEKKPRPKSRDMDIEGEKESAKAVPEIRETKYQTTRLELQEKKETSSECAEARNAENVVVEDDGDNVKLENGKCESEKDGKMKDSRSGHQDRHRKHDHHTCSKRRDDRKKDDSKKKEDKIGDDKKRDDKSRKRGRDGEDKSSGKKTKVEEYSRKRRDESSRHSRHGEMQEGKRSKNDEGADGKEDSKLDRKKSSKERCSQAEDKFPKDGDSGSDNGERREGSRSLQSIAGKDVESGLPVERGSDYGSGGKTSNSGSAQSEAEFKSNDEGVVEVASVDGEERKTKKGESIENSEVKVIAEVASEGIKVEEDVKVVKDVDNAASIASSVKERRKNCARKSWEILIKGRGRRGGGRSFLPGGCKSVGYGNMNSNSSSPSSVESENIASVDHIPKDCVSSLEELVEKDDTVAKKMPKTASTLEDMMRISKLRKELKAKAGVAVQVEVHGRNENDVGEGSSNHESESKIERVSGSQLSETRANIGKQNKKCMQKRPDGKDGFDKISEKEATDEQNVTANVDFNYVAAAADCNDEDDTENICHQLYNNLLKECGISE